MMTLSPAQLSFFAENGYLILNDLLTAEEKLNIVAWSNEVKSWPEDSELGYLPYQEVDSKGKLVLCRTEVPLLLRLMMAMLTMNVELRQLP